MLVNRQMSILEHTQRLAKEFKDLKISVDGIIHIQDMVVGFQVSMLIHNLNIKDFKNHSSLLLLTQKELCLLVKLRSAVSEFSPTLTFNKQKKQQRQDKVLKVLSLLTKFKSSVIMHTNTTNQSILSSNQNQTFKFQKHCGTIIGSRLYHQVLC